MQIIFKRAYSRHTLNLNIKIFWQAWGLLLRGQALSGASIREFEKKFSGYIGSPYAIGVESARKGLYLILKSLNFDEHDEVITPAYTFKALPVGVIACGLKPVFVDIDPHTYNIDPGLIEGSISQRTKAILVTHMFGQPADMDRIVQIARKHDLFVIEDCAHACGAQYKDQNIGSIGDAAIFSFNMGKNLSCFGGGMITTNNQAVYEQVAAKVEEFPYPKLRNLIKEIIVTFIFYCATHPKMFVCVTYPVFRILDMLGSDFSDRTIEEKLNINQGVQALKRQTRLPNLSAAIGLTQLETLDVTNERRRQNALMLMEELRGMDRVTLPEEGPSTKSVFLYLRAQFSGHKLDILRKKLLSRGIDTKRDDMNACSRLDVFKSYKAPCPVAERLHLESIEIPNNPLLKEEDVKYIAQQIKSAIRE